LEQIKILFPLKFQVSLSATLFITKQDIPFPLLTTAKMTELLSCSSTDHEETIRKEKTMLVMTHAADKEEHSGAST
jgi:hypothetical protein